jgi:hypothetical protein
VGTDEFQQHVVEDIGLLDIKHMGGVRDDP